VTPGYTFDCNGDASFRAHVGIGVGVPPLPGQYHLNCGSAHFISVWATNATVDANLGVGGNVTVTGTLYATLGAFGIGPQVGFYLSAGNLYVSAASQLLGDVQCFATLAVQRAAVPGYWLTATNAYFNTADVGGALGVASTLNVTGNVTCGNQLFVTNNVGIGVGAQAGWHLTLAGSGAQKVGGGPWAEYSSRTMKRNIQRIDNALPLLLAQRGCSYEWAEETRAALLPGTRYGLVAEEVTLPQWRQEQEDGTVAIAANGFEALCIESLRELVTRLEALEDICTR
jgi:hypothetical protein